MSLAGATEFCDDKCVGFQDIIPAEGLEGDVIVTVNGTDYDIGDYEYRLDIPTLSATSGGGTTFFAAQGFSCLDCYAYLAPEVQIVLQWNEFYVTDFRATLSGRSKVNVGLGFVDPVILEIGNHLYPLHNESNFTDKVDFGLFTMDSRKSLMFEVGGFGRAAGAGTITGDVSAYGQISGKYKKLNAPDPHLWTHDYDGSYFKANISDIDISHLDLEEFGVDFSLIPSMDMRLIGTGFPFEGLEATTTASIRATTGFEITNKVPDSNLKIKVSDAVTTAGNDMEVILTWKNAMHDEDTVEIFIHNDCWDDKLDFTKSNQAKLFWSVPYDASLAQLNFIGMDQFAGLTVCDPERYFLSLHLGKDKITEYHSNEFKLNVNAVDGGYGVTSPKNGDKLFSGEHNIFEWNHEGYYYFTEASASTRTEVKNVSVVLYGAETDCTISPLINSIVELFDPQWGCEESWVQITPSVKNNGHAEIFVPPQTLDGKNLLDFHEVHASIIGVDNTNVFSRNEGQFRVFEGCPSEERYELTFHLNGKSSLHNVYTWDVQTGWYFTLHPHSKRDEKQSTKRMGAGAEADIIWNNNPTLDKYLTVYACKSDNVKLKAWEVDDVTYMEGLDMDDTYGVFGKSAETWMQGSGGTGDGKWTLNAVDSSGTSGGNFDVTVTGVLKSVGGMPVGGGGGGRKLDAGGERGKDNNLRGMGEVAAVPGARRRLHHDDCVTMYYHIDTGITMTNVQYTQPDVLREWTDPVANFLGYEQVETITLYNEPSRMSIDVIPYTEYTLHNFEGFDCSMLRKPPTYWENLWEGFLQGQAKDVAIVVSGGVATVAATGGSMYLAYIVFVGGGFAGAKALRGAGKKGGAGGEEDDDDTFGLDEVQVGMDDGRSKMGRLQKMGSSFNFLNPMRNAPPPPPPPPEQKKRKTMKEKAKNATNLDSSKKNIFQMFGLIAGRRDDPSEAEMEMAMNMAHQQNRAGESAFAGAAKEIRRRHSSVIDMEEQLRRVKDRARQLELENELLKEKERVRQLEEQLKKAKGGDEGARKKLVQMQSDSFMED
ncbi:hypothetical protein TrRE_jg12082 [Triparma retinervis]|uniref:Uncharacterized protein n=1 Tax=Triparma retinervis TaxID=2557542 RepID=A0A9W6ZMW8_9STRA|nr:hypothetical protein TrRE_jg12082 [Triparma retinervis]